MSSEVVGCSLARQAQNSPARSSRDSARREEASNRMTKRGNIDTGRVVFIVVMLSEPRLRECGAWGVEASLPAPVSIAPNL